MATTMDEQLAAYEASRARIDALVRDADEAQLAATVPCCPAWTAKDLVGHVTGVLEDRIAGRLPTDGFEGWTDAQVERHRDEPVADVLDAWHRLDLQRDDAPPSWAALSYDVVSHEHDLFGAFGRAGDHETDSVRVGADRARERMASVLSASSAPGVLLTMDDGDAVLLEGASAPIALSTSSFTLMRLVAGRVSRAQAEALAWDGEPGAVLDALWADGFFTPQPRDVLDC